MGRRGCLLGIRRMDGVPNAQIRDVRGVTKGVDEILKEWNMKGLEKVYMWESVGVVT